jgi:hypothetical protein
MPCLGPVQPTYPHLMRLLRWCPAESHLPPDAWPSWPSCGFLSGTWQHRTYPPGGGEVRALEAGPGAQAHRGLAPTRGSTRPPGGSGPVEAIPEHPVLEGYVEAPDL